MHIHREKLAVQTPGGDVLSRNRGRVRHLVLFVFACILLIGALVFLLGAISLSAPLEPSAEPSEPQIPGGEILTGFLLASAYVLAELCVTVGFTVCWGGGQVISALLAMDRRNKPRWLWIASWVLALVFLAVMLLILSPVVPIALPTVWAACGS